VKSGRKIFEELEDCPRGRVLAIQKLGNGSLRSLLAYAQKGRRTYAETSDGEMIVSLAILEATKRFVYGKQTIQPKGMLP